MPIEIKRRKLLWTLSGAVDFVGVTDISHGKRVAYLADTIRDKYNSFPWSQDDVITAGLLHDCGVSSTDIHEHLISEMEWEKASDHCIRGEKLLLEQPEYSHLAKAIRKHHSRWCLLKKDRDGLLGNLIFLADRIDVLAATSKKDILTAKDSIIKSIINLRGTLFSPELVDIFLKLSQRDIFWLNWGECHTGEVMNRWLEEEEAINIEYSSLKRPFSLFSSCVDGKSPFTYNHSSGVASLGRKIAELYGIKGENIDKIELAGLMHDLGKLKVPDIILDKPGKLDFEEFNIMRHHSYDTFKLLSKIDGMEEITKWASQHHEKLNGKGYPKAEREENIPIESRILAVADIFQALAQDRPYKKGLPQEKILEILKDMCIKKELDPHLVNLVEKNQDECMRAALIET